MADGARRRVRALPATLLLACLACEAPPRDPPPPTPPPAVPPPAAVTPPEPSPPEQTREPIPGRGTYFDFQWAMEPDEPGTRARRLEAWIDRHDPAVEGLEDAVHARLWRVAHYRLVRAYYRTGRLGAADSVLAMLEATDAEVR